MDHLEKVLEDLGFSATERKTLLDPTKIVEHDQIISDCRGRYNDVLIKQPEVKELMKKDPEIKEFFKSEYELNAKKEAVRKERKQINTDLNLGLSASKLDELTKEEFSALVKEHGSKSADQKITDLELQVAEERKLKETAIKERDEEVEKVKSEYKQKDITREVELKKARKISAMDDKKFDKSDMTKIDDSITGAAIREKVSFLTDDDGEVYIVDEKGQKKRDKANNFIKYEDWLEPILSRFEIKQRGTPDIDPVTGKPVEEKPEMSDHAKEMAKLYEQRGINTGVPA